MPLTMLSPSSVVVGLFRGSYDAKWRSRSLIVNGLTTFECSLTTLAKPDKPHLLDVENWCGIVDAQADGIHLPQNQQAS